MIAKWSGGARLEWGKAESGNFTNLRGIGFKWLIEHPKPVHFRSKIGLFFRRPFGG